SAGHGRRRAARPAPPSGEPLNQSTPGWRRSAARTVGGVEVEAAVRSRRTHKAYGAEPVPRRVVEELLELARWAPNHHLTEPWRFRVLGPQTLTQLVAAAEASEGLKLRRAPTLGVASASESGSEHQNAKDLLATACAVYIVLLAANAR